jgi:hypothetical protein
MDHMVYFLHILTQGDGIFNSCLTPPSPLLRMAGLSPAIFFLY